VLVRGGVEDDVRLEALHHLEHAIGLLAVGEHRLHPSEVPLLEHLAIDAKEVVLRVVEQHQQSRPDSGDLPAQLGADRPAGARDEHDLVLQVGAHAVQLHHHRVAPQHVLDPHFAQLPGELDAAAQELEHRRQRPHRDVALPAGGHDLGPQDAGGRGDRDDDLVRFLAVEDLPDLVRRAQDLHPRRGHVALPRIIVHEPDRPRAEVRVQTQLPHHHLAARSGADDQQAARSRAAGRPVRALRERPPNETRPAHQHDGEQEVEHHDGAREVVVEGLGERKDRHEDSAGHRCRAHDRPHVRELEVPPPFPVQAEKPEDDRLADRDEGDRFGEHLQVPIGDPDRHVDEAQHERQRECHRRQHGVGDELKRATPVYGVAHTGHPSECNAALPRCLTSLAQSSTSQRTSSTPSDSRGSSC
jgi:hypothetical protein